MTKEARPRGRKPAADSPRRAFSEMMKEGGKMSLTDRKIAAWTNPVAAESDRPNRSAAAMKTVFDSNSNQLKDAVNGICDDCEIAAAVVRLEPSEENADMKCLHLDGTYRIPSVGRAYGNGLPAGGETGQLLVKKSGAAYDAEWRPLRTAEASSVALAAAEWAEKRQTVPCAGMTEAANVIVSPSEESRGTYGGCGVRCVGQGADELTFACDALPTEDLTVNALRLL